MKSDKNQCFTQFGADDVEEMGAEGEPGVDISHRVSDPPLSSLERTFNSTIEYMAKISAESESKPSYSFFTTVAELEAYMLFNDTQYREKQTEFRDKRTSNLLPQIDEKNACFYIRSQENLNISIFSILCAIKPMSIMNGNNFFYHNNNILYVVFDSMASYPIIINRIVKNDLMILHSKYNYIKFFIDKDMISYIDKNSCDYQISVVKTDQSKYFIKYDIQYLNNNNSMALSSSEQEVIVNKEILLRMGRNVDLSKEFNHEKVQEAYSSVFNIRDLENLSILFAFKIKSPELLTKNTGEYKIFTHDDIFHCEFKGATTRTKVVNTSIFGRKVDALCWSDVDFSGMVKIKHKIPSRDGFKQFKDVLFTVCKDSTERHYVLIILSQRPIIEASNTIDLLLSSEAKPTKKAIDGIDKNRLSNTILLLFGVENLM